MVSEERQRKEASVIHTYDEFVDCLFDGGVTVARATYARPGSQRRQGREDAHEPRSRCHFCLVDFVRCPRVASGTVPVAIPLELPPGYVQATHQQ